MTSFNINSLSNTQKGIIGLVLGVLLLLHSLNIIHLNWILIIISAVLIVYGLIKTNLLEKITKFVKRQLKKHPLE